ncbi:MAG: acetyltransferase [Woeseiaceae bacterium]|nr:acetyltransferase [Woeseiaceae bacterium]
MKRLLVIGAGGHGIVVADAASMTDNWSDIAFVDDRFPDLKKVATWPVVGTVDSLNQLAADYDAAVVAIGNPKVRIALMRKASRAGLSIATIVHPSAVVSRLAHIGGGTVLLANAVVNARAILGEGCIVNTAATVDHDCRIANGAHIAPGAHLAADVFVGERSWIGAGCAVREQTHVGNDVMVGAGAAVVSSVADKSTVAGVPAKPLLTAARRKMAG